MIDKPKPTALQLARYYLPVLRKVKRGRKLGDTYASTQLMYVGGHVVIRAAANDPNMVLHELCHALIGPSSLVEEESALMPLEWGFMQLVCDEDYAVCRRSFVDYGLGGSCVGEADSFLTTMLWKRDVRRAQKRGLLTQSGQVSRRLAVHPGWDEWVSQMTMEAEE